MQLIRDIVRRRLDASFIARKNNKDGIYEFIQALSLASAYLKLKKGFVFDSNDAEIGSILFKNYYWVCLNNAIRNVPITSYHLNPEELNTIVHDVYSTINKPYLSELFEYCKDRESILIDFFNEFPKGDEKKEEVIFRDRKVDWSIGVVKND